MYTHSRALATRARARLRAGLGLGLDLVFPPECAHCRVALETSSGGLICPECQDALVDRSAACIRCGASYAQASSGQGCLACQNQKQHFEAVVRLGRYEGALRTAVLHTKGQRFRGLAVALGRLLGSVRDESLRALRADAVVPIPMHWSRRVWRGANCPEVLADCLAASLRVPNAGHLLARSRRTIPQASLSPAKRRANVRGAFRASSHPELKGGRLLLVDDVMTTGATVNEAAKTLSRLGAQVVGVAVLARAHGQD